jgi:hypothetical protein
VIFSSLRVLKLLGPANQGRNVLEGFPKAKIINIVWMGSDIIFILLGR